MMKTTGINPETKFKYLLKGSATARNLSFVYILVSIILAYKMRDHVEYIITLILGALLILWYTLTHLMLKEFKLKKIDLKNQFKRYRSHILKREKYESTVYFIWLLTILPAFLFGKEISIFTAVRYMVIAYLVIVIGNYLFKKTMNELNELEMQINKID